MKIAIVDDWSKSLRTLPCFAKLENLDVKIFSDHISTINDRIKQLNQFDENMKMNDKLVEVMDQLYSEIQRLLEDAESRSTL